MFGWTGKIAQIDLHRKTWDIEDADFSILEKFIGGRGLAGYFLKKSINYHREDPAMPILLFTGPLVNTLSPTSGRMTIMSVSPLTNTIGDSSVGGTLGTSIKKAGFDGLIIKGRSADLTGIEINDYKITFVSAKKLAGKTTTQTSSALKGRGSVAAIGPAAENGVLFSNVIIDNHFAAGRNGLGLVFARKNLKYITVKGTGKTPVYDINALKKARDDIFRLVSASPAVMGKFGISKFGTGALYDLMDARHMMPTDNFRKTRFEFSDSMNAHAYKEKYNPESTGCAGCHIRCKKKTDKGLAIPEFETMSHFSALIGNKDIETVVYANKICNEAGMDTISAASTIACYMEIFGKKLTPEMICSILKDIVSQTGEGKKLGLGSARFAELMGKSNLSMSVKKQELSAYDPRGAYGMALSFAVSTRGACHLRAYPVSHEILRKPVATDRFTFLGKARIIKIGEDLNAVIDSLTACKFIFFAASIEEYANVFSAVTGIKTSGHNLLFTGERICYNERIMNAKRGFTKNDDDLPLRFFEKDDNSDDKTEPINREEFLCTRDKYYKVRGLDNNGMPVHEKALKLDLED